MVDKLNKIDDDFFLDPDDDDIMQELNSKDCKEDKQVYEQLQEDGVDNQDDDVNADMDEYTVRIFGLDNSGKTTLMMNLISPNEGFEAEVTEDFNADTYTYKDAKINFWDLSGKKENREYWKSYFHMSDGFIYVVDISDTGRLNEAKTTLHSSILTEDNEGIPVLIYANKSDKLNKAFEAKDAYTLLEIKPSDFINIQVCSAKKCKGLVEGFDWLYNKIKV